MRPGRIGAIINPRAGGWRRHAGVTAPGDMGRTVAGWLAPGAPACVETRLMRAADDGARLAHELLSAGCETIVAVGGDGTINDVIQGLCGHECAARARLGLIPMGTANVLARVLSLPLHAPELAGQVVQAGQERVIDLGRMGERWFALVAGIGFDGAVTRAVDLRLKQRVGELAYALAALKVAGGFPRPRVTLTLDDRAPQAFDAYLTLVANGGRYAGRYELGAEVRIDDGWLDVFVCLRHGPLLADLLTHSLALSRGRLAQTPGIAHFRARRIVVTSSPSLPVELDGDAGGETPITITLAPAALRLLAPTAVETSPAAPASIPA